MIEIIKIAIRIMQNKLSRPAYAEYRKSNSLQLELYRDCLYEAKAQFEMWGACK